MKNTGIDSNAGRRALADLFLGLVLAVVLALLNISINFIDAIRDHFVLYSYMPLAEWLIWFLFFWFVFLLSLAFIRWRAVARWQAELETIISGINPDVLVVADPEDRIVLINSSLTRLFGYEKEEMIGKNIDVLYEHWRLGSDAPEALRKGFAKDGFYIGVAVGKKKSGETFPLEAIGAQLSGGMGRVMLLRDISERCAAQMRQTELEKREEQWKKFQSLAVLAGGIAHDFKNLLTVVMSNADMALQSVPADQKTGNCFSNIVSASQKAAGLCNQMLAYSGRSDAVNEDFDFSECVKQAGQLIRVKITEEIALDYDLCLELPRLVGDSMKVRQVVANVLANAIDAVSENKGSVSVRTGMQRVSEEELAGTYVNDHLPAGDYVFCEVEDTGCGMDATTVEQMFDPFFTTKFLGRGLELSFALGVIRSHNGAVDVTSEPDKGTRVRIYLPCLRSPQEPDGSVS